jgi:hypothetical protein
MYTVYTIFPRNCDRLYNSILFQKHVSIISVIFSLRNNSISENDGFVLDIK